MVTTRTCTTCLEIKDLTEFAIKNGSRRHYKCKECVRSYRNKLYQQSLSHKHCCLCKKLKPCAEFPVKVADTGKLASRCLVCQNAYSASHYRRNKSRVLAANRQRRKDTVAFVNSLKCQPCLDCGGTFKPHQMDFDHKHSKVKDIASMAGNTFSKESILKEIAKCDLVCANCHRERTHQRRHSSLGG